MQETIWPRMGLHVHRAFVQASLTLAAGVLATGCARSGLFGSTVSPAGASFSRMPSAARVPEGGTVRSAVAGPTQAGGSAAEGIPFGIFGLPGRKLVPPFTAAMQQARPESILKDLAAAKARDARVVVS